ncbi:MAG: N-acetyl-gamma-glutamyl-phosphate reductase [Bacillota bacterium]
MIRIGIMGVTGYAGAELLRLLLAHPQAHVTYLASHSFEGKQMSSVYPGFAGISLPTLETVDAEAAAEKCDVVFTALPHGVSGEVIPALYKKGVAVIDLSGDFRYDDPEVYKTWYGFEHSSPELLKESVYGMPELHREKIKSARLIGNPGCYTTCSILALAPLVKHRLIDVQSIVIDAKSGASGAGRGLSEQTHFCELDESMKAYGIGTHRHTSEIEQELGCLNGAPIQLSFTPHLLPIKRGILATSYAKPTSAANVDELLGLYGEFFKGEPFVTICAKGKLPELKHVVGSNRVSIGVCVDARVNRVIVVSCIDNLIKGAAGQAIQNMNIVFGLEETMGLELIPWQI